MSSKSKPLLERMKHLLSTGSHADVHFLVGEGDKKELLPAHKNIMAMSSDVFEAMFRFDAENTENAAKNNTDGKTPFGVDNPVEVPGVDIGAFKVMLNYIYLDDLSSLNGNNAMAVLYAANKYNIPGLIEACVGIPINELPNVFLAYAQAKLLHEDFALRCLHYIDQNADTLFADSENFLQIDQALLCEILSRDQLEISREMSIWKAALCWADEQCRQNGMECSAENRRAMLGPALYKIHIPFIPKEEFGRRIVPSGVLTKNELIGVYQYYCHPNSIDDLFPLQFPTRQRNYNSKGWIVFIIEKFSEFAREDEGSWRHSDAVYVRGLPWKISTVLLSKKLSNKIFCLIFQCNGEDKDPNWSCACSATLRIVAQKEGAEDRIWKSSHNFDAEHRKRFMGFEDLMDPSKGWYNEAEDSVTVVADFTAEEPIGIE